MEMEAAAQIVFTGFYLSYRSSQEIIPDFVLAGLICSITSMAPVLV